MNLTPNSNANEEVQPLFTSEEKNRIQQLKSQIDLSSPAEVIQYGIASQNSISAFSNEILKQVQTKELGEAQDILIDLRTNIKDFDSVISEKSFFSFFDSIVKRIKRIRAKYSSIESNINAIELRLERHYKTLLKDINVFEKLFDENQSYYKELCVYIAAGDERLLELHNKVLPQLKADADSSGDVEKIQEYKDMEQQVFRFERRLHDLKLTRTVVLQNAPQIRLIQNNSVALTEKLQSSIVNTLPLWKNQMVLTLGIAHAQAAVEAQKAITDTTNELLKKNSEMLKDASVKVATENERGIVDIETIKKVNADILSTIDDVIRIQKEGREKRATVEIELKATEDELKNHLIKSVN